MVVLFRQPVKRGYFTPHSRPQNHSLCAVSRDVLPKNYPLRFGFTRCILPSVSRSLHHFPPHSVAPQCPKAILGFMVSKKRQYQTPARMRAEHSALWKALIAKSAKGGHIRSAQELRRKFTSYAAKAASQNVFVVSARRLPGSFYKKTLDSNSNAVSRYTRFIRSRSQLSKKCDCRTEKWIKL